MRLDAYIRVSRVAGREGDTFISPDVQRERITKLAELGGHEIVHEHVDLDEPGSKWTRPGFQAALERVEAGETDGIIVAALDRFARSVPDAAVALRRLDNAGAVLLSAREQLDTSSPVGRFARTMMLAMAELELDRIRESWNVAQAHAVARGVHVASRTPTGYLRADDGRLHPDLQAAPVIRELFLRRARGDGWTALAEYLDSTDITGPYGNTTWAPSTVQKIISNPVYLGQARAGAHVNEDAHEPLVSRSEWEAAQSAHGTSSPRSGDGRLLSGLIRCAGCRYVMKPDTMRDRDGSRLVLYRCRGRHPAGKCPAPASVLGRVIEPLVEEAFLSFAAGATATSVDDTHETDEALRALEDAEAELAAYNDQTLVRVVGREAFAAGLRARADAVDGARRTLQSISGQATAIASLSSATLAEDWETLGIAERRALLTAAMDAVFVRSGRNIDISDRTMIFWRGEAPVDLPRRGHRVPLAPLDWPRDGKPTSRVASTK